MSHLPGPCEDPTGHLSRPYVTVASGSPNGKRGQGRIHQVKGFRRGRLRKREDRRRPTTYCPKATLSYPLHTSTFPSEEGRGPDVGLMTRGAVVSTAVQRTATLNLLSSPQGRSSIPSPTKSEAF